MSVLSTHGLTVRYGAHEALSSLSVEVSEGVTGLLGPNGAGKSTTLRLLAGTLAMSAGTARVAGFDLFDERREAQARIGYLPDVPPLYPELRVAELLGFAADLRGVAHRERARRVGAVLETVDLVQRESARVGTLSRGEQQRLGIALAMVHDPAVLILDEPTTGLDPAQLDAFRELLRALARDRLVVLSTHVLAEVEHLCERILLLAGGRLVGDGTREALAELAGLPAWVELELDSPHDDVSARLAAIEAVDAVERAEDGTYRVLGGPPVEPTLGAVAGAHGWRIRRLARRPPSLHEVFVALAEDA